MEFIKDWAGILALIVAPVSAYFAVKTRSATNTYEINVLKSTMAQIESERVKMQEDISELEKREAANDARRDDMYKMQEETRQDVKKILISITELATKVSVKE